MWITDRDLSPTARHLRWSCAPLGSASNTSLSIPKWSIERRLTHLCFERRHYILFSEASIVHQSRETACRVFSPLVVSVECGCTADVHAQSRGLDGSYSCLLRSPCWLAIVTWRGGRCSCGCHTEVQHAPQQPPRGQVAEDRPALLGTEAATLRWVSRPSQPLGTEAATLGWVLMRNHVLHCPTLTAGHDILWPFPCRRTRRPVSQRPSPSHTHPQDCMSCRDPSCRTFTRSTGYCSPSERSTRSSRSLGKRSVCYLHASYLPAA